MANEFQKFLAKRNSGAKTVGPVANHAQQGQMHRKMRESLERRRSDYSRTMDTKNTHGGIQQRKDNGGFHRPGSNTK